VGAPPPDDHRILAGQRHRTLADVEALVYDYDSLGVTSRWLPAGTVFVPWEPLDHWRGVRVPITLGGDAAGFDWGVTAPEGHFLRWEDFFRRCAPAEGDTDSAALRRGIL
jgi:hypothetical protein